MTLCGLLVLLGSDQANLLILRMKAERRGLFSALAPSLGLWKIIFRKYRG